MRYTRAIDLPERGATMRTGTLAVLPSRNVTTVGPSASPTSAQLLIIGQLLIIIRLTNAPQRTSEAGGCAVSTHPADTSWVGCSPLPGLPLVSPCLPLPCCLSPTHYLYLEGKTQVPTAASNSAASLNASIWVQPNLQPTGGASATLGAASQLEHCDRSTIPTGRSSYCCREHQGHPSGQGQARLGGHGPLLELAAELYSEVRSDPSLLPNSSVLAAFRAAPWLLPRWHMVGAVCAGVARSGACSLVCAIVSVLRRSMPASGRAYPGWPGGAHFCPLQAPQHPAICWHA